MLELIAGKYNYWMYIVLMMIGLYGMMGKRNLIKKVVGMSIFQSAIILFYVSIACKKGGTIPILEHVHGHGHEEHIVHVASYINPLPHVLMLTAIVVAVSTLGVALAVAITVYRRYNTLEEDEILGFKNE